MKKYKSDALASVHEMMEDLYESGIINKKTMRDFDDACLTPLEPMTPEEIRSIREREHISQNAFSIYLNVSKGLVSQWERGVKHPSGASLKLLSLVKKNGLSAII